MSDRLIDLKGTILDLDRVIAVGPLVGEQACYTIHCDGGFSVFRFHEERVDTAFFPREKFISLWRDYLERNKP